MKSLRPIASATALLLSVAVANDSLAVNDVGGTLITLTNTATAPNGAWSWFEDERAIIDDSDPDNTLLLVSSVSSAASGNVESGDVDLLWLNVDTGAQGEYELHNRLERDDHDSAALHIRSDGRFVAMYSKHSTDRLTRYRISTNPGDPTAWDAELTTAGLNSTDGPASRGTTYNNIHYLPNDNGGAGRLYNFTRSDNLDPNVQVSDDEGATWTHIGKLLTEAGSNDRPYMRYFSDGDKIHFTATNRHPHDYDNNLYHGYVKDGQLRASDGSVMDSNIFDYTGVGPSSLTPIFTAGTVIDGEEMHRAWNTDVAIDNGVPVAIFTARADDSRDDHRFFYARYESGSWNVHQMAKAGGYLYNSQWDYTGLAAIDPNDTETVYVSTEVDPRNNAPMPHYEIFRGRTDDGGATWQWEPITFDSTVDNLRPLVPEWNENETALVWMRGSYNTFTSWDTEVVALTDIQPLTTVSIADLDGMNGVDLADYAMYLAGLHADFSRVTDPAVARLMGDLNGDFQNDFNDFLIFESEYNLHNGMNALSTDVSTVPESGTLTLFVMTHTLTSIFKR